jgi:threonine dehydratase
MSRFYKKQSHYEGATPLLELSNFARKERLKAKIIAKLEYFNSPADASEALAKGSLQGLIKAKEIWADMDGRVDVFVAPCYGNIANSVGRALKRRNPNIKVVAVAPTTMTEHSGAGLAEAIATEDLDMNVVDEVVTVPYDQAVATGRKLARKEGLLVGIASGAAVAAAAQLAQRSELVGHNIVAVLPDTGENRLMAMFG